MKSSRFSGEQITGILKEHRAVLSAVELCRKCGVSDATFYKWRSKYGRMEIAEAKRLKALEDENGRLQRLLADAMLDVSTLKGMFAKTSEARHKDERRDLSNGRKGLLPPPSLQPGRHRSACVPQSVDAGR